MSTDELKNNKQMCFIARITFAFSEIGTRERSSGCESMATETECGIIYSAPCEVPDSLLSLLINKMNPAGIMETQTMQFRVETISSNYYKLPFSWKMFAAERARSRWVRTS